MKTTEVKIYGTKSTANIDAEIIKKVKENNPNKEVFVCFNTKVKLSKLPDDEAVCWGDGETYVLILKNKPANLFLYENNSHRKLK